MKTNLSILSILLIFFTSASAQIYADADGFLKIKKDTVTVEKVIVKDSIVYVDKVVYVDRVVYKDTCTATTPPPIVTSPPATNYGTLVFQTGFENAMDVNTNQGQYNTRSSSIVKSGAYSFRTEVKVNQTNLYGGYRSEMQYSTSPVEAVIEYDVYYENWRSFSDGGHTIQWHHPTSTGGTPLSLQNYGGQFQIVRLVNGNFTVEPVAPISVVPNKWYNMRWEIKWSSTATGYVRFYIDGKLYYSYTGLTCDTQGIPYLKLGQNRWPDTNGGAIRDQTIVYYDNLKVWKK